MESGLVEHAAEGKSKASGCYLYEHWLSCTLYIKLNVTS